MASPIVSPIIQYLLNILSNLSLLQANFLYFGCRSALKDQHYASEWRSYSENQQIHYRAAFSRDGPEGEKRTYVQDLIRQDSEQIWKLVGELKGWVLISG